MNKTSVRELIKDQFRHFNAGETARAADAFERHLQTGGKMIVTLSGGLSSAGIGKSLGKMIAKDKVHAICATGANFEEDLFRLFAPEGYISVTDWRYFDAQEEMRLFQEGFARVTDIGVNLEKTMFKTARLFIAELKRLLAEKGGRWFPSEIVRSLFDRIENEGLSGFAGREKDSWVWNALQKNLPILLPGWEDSTLGHCYSASVIRGEFDNVHAVKSGVDYTMQFAHWFRETANRPSGLFQIGGGIAGDFAICIVPMLRDGCKIPVPHWSYFCQISDAVTSYGGYSGAPPNEKITWGKLDTDSQGFMIQSDASIVAPLMFAYIMEESENGP